MKGKYLITTDAWFIAPDGLQYKAAWGDIEILSDSILGVKTNRVSTNWYAKIGSESKHIVVAGCQILYSIRCEARPNTDNVNDQDTEGKAFNRHTIIYIAE